MIFRIQDGRIPPFFFALAIRNRRQFCANNFIPGRKPWHSGRTLLLYIVGALLKPRCFCKKCAKNRFHFHKVGRGEHEKQSLKPPLWTLMYIGTGGPYNEDSKRRKTMKWIYLENISSTTFFLLRPTKVSKCCFTGYMSILHWLFHQRVMLWLQNERYKSDLSAVPGTLRAWAASTLVNFIRDLFWGTG